MNKNFNQYNQENPQIFEEFKKITFRLLDAGRTHYGAKGVIEIIRYNTLVGSQGYQKKTDFKINNNYAPDYARLFMIAYPIYSEFFRTRELKNIRQ